MLSRSHRFLFIHIPKTAGNSIQRALLPYSEDRMVTLAPYQDGIDRFEIRSPRLDVHKHSTLAEYRAKLSDQEYADLFVFHVIRNPWDRCVSHFFSPHRGPVDWSENLFAEFIEQVVRPAEMYVASGPDDANPFGNAHAVIRFEHLEEEFLDVCRKISLPPMTLPHANKSGHIDYRVYFKSDRLIEAVARKFTAEIEQFGYGFDPR